MTWVPTRGQAWGAHVLGGLLTFPGFLCLLSPLFDLILIDEPGDRRWEGQCGCQLAIGWTLLEDSSMLGLDRGLQSVRSCPEESHLDSSDVSPGLTPAQLLLCVPLNHESRRDPGPP